MRLQAIRYFSGMCSKRYGFWYIPSIHIFSFTSNQLVQRCTE